MAKALKDYKAGETISLLHNAGIKANYTILQHETNGQTNLALLTDTTYAATWGRGGEVYENYKNRLSASIRNRILNIRSVYAEELGVYRDDIDHYPAKSPVPAIVANSQHMKGWTENAAWPNRALRFCYGHGLANIETARRFVPIFALSSSLILLDDGNVTENRAPNAPSSITVPATVNGGKSLAISWGAATDPDGNFSGYKLERSYSGGAWAQIYQGSALNYNDNITFGWTSVAYRVRAFDSLNAHSGYATSPTRTVINNTAPNAPTTINVPDGIKGGTTITVSWPAATDAQNNVSGYVLERSVNAGNWTQEYKGSALSSSQPITKGWNTVQFRVKAYDAYNLESGWTTSPSRSIINNSPPTQPPSISYGDPRAGKQITITCGASTDPDKDPIQYVWEAHTDSNPYSQIGITSATTINHTVPTSGKQYQVRVRAADNQGNESGYMTGPAKTILYNDPPKISGADTDLGDLTASGLTYKYTVTDDKTANLSVVITVNGQTRQSISVPPGVEQTFSIVGADWVKMLNGTNQTVVITAKDAEGEQAVRRLTFTKRQSKIEFYLAEPKVVEERPYRIAVNMSAEIPSEAEFKVMACSNALDDNPAWEDITIPTQAGRAHIFENTTCQSGQWAVDLHVNVDRGSAAGDCYIKGFTYAFETD